MLKIKTLYLKHCVDKSFEKCNLLCQNLAMLKINLNKIKDVSFGLLLALLLFISIAVYAQQDETLQKWQAIWHGTDWIGSGETIRAREIAENFEYLYKELDQIKEIINNNSTSTNPTTNITYEMLPSGSLVGGCFADYLTDSLGVLDRIYRINCYGEGVSARQNGISIIGQCPSYAKLIYLYRDIGWRDIENTYFESQVAHGFLCIKK